MYERGSMKHRVLLCRRQQIKQDIAADGGIGALGVLCSLQCACRPGCKKRYDHIVRRDLNGGRLISLRPSQCQQVNAVSPRCTQAKAFERGNFAGQRHCPFSQVRAEDQIPALGVLKHRHMLIQGKSGVQRNSVNARFHAGEVNWNTVDAVVD